MKCIFNIVQCFKYIILNYLIVLIRKCTTRNSKSFFIAMKFILYCSRNLRVPGRRDMISSRNVTSFNYLAARPNKPSHESSHVRACVCIHKNVISYTR